MSQPPSRCRPLIGANCGRVHETLSQFGQHFRTIRADRLFDREIEQFFDECRADFVAIHQKSGQVTFAAKTNLLTTARFIAPGGVDRAFVIRFADSPKASNRSSVNPNGLIKL